MALKGRRFDTRESIIADSKKVTPNFDVQHIHKHSSDKDIKLNAFSKKVGTPKNQMNHCLIDLDSPNIFSNINNIPTTHPSKSLLDEDNIEEVPHVPLLEALGPKPITLLPTNVTNLQANPRVEGWSNTLVLDRYDPGSNPYLCTFFLIKINAPMALDSCKSPTPPTIASNQMRYGRFVNAVANFYRP
ncbi:hypothetical protein LAZ67_X000891 [Cordylochernes scorpioides]|uniref:Uncharacterized protein n=1 Tax=Cordylochernes scorpioides TaxID=51811 RepID=A0ABY6LWA0_9ARAC|nr:hypothetical protein LAZ67_X000891 [Cordylochernes scorpioides]